MVHDTMQCNIENQIASRYIIVENISIMLTGTVIARVTDYY